ncbi:F-box only protein 7 [Desmophyllum pertusum]|uniref:F-box only protein 7 n=1 Tax=Desmophyllum pertusum TaxID=174260 RepID=A0A9W9Z7G1_9CNID|nr:F-box only protein 7 [Desmophyllum pertusum]
MKLRVVLNRQREVLELLGDAITLRDCREAIHRKFGLRTDSFNLSLNGQDVLDNESVQLADLGIVNGDLIYILYNTDERGDELSSQNTYTPGTFRDTSHTNQRRPCHLVQYARDPPQQSREKQHGSQGKDKAKRSETEQTQLYSGSASSLRYPVLLCREGIPQTLEDLYKTMDVGTIHEAAWVVIHVLMLETGYICASEDSMEETEIDDSSGILPSREWKKGGIAKTMYTHPSCPGLTCSLTCTSLGPYIMVHGLADSVSKVKYTSASYNRLILSGEMWISKQMVGT